MPYAAGLAPSPSSRALLPPISSSVQSAPSRTAHSTISAVCRWARCAVVTSATRPVGSALLRERGDALAAVTGEGRGPPAGVLDLES